MPATPPDDRAEPKAEPGALRILGRANSFNVRKVLWLCDEIGVPFVREDWGRGFRSTDDAEFRRLNPTGQVPVVIDDGQVLRESNVIIRYLAGQARDGGAVSFGAGAPRRRRAVDGLVRL